MLGKNFRIALLLSIGLHIIGMSVITIITPEDIWRARQYTKVNFLGPIFKKTAFDIMLENVNSVVRTACIYTIPACQKESLEIAVLKKDVLVWNFPEYPGKNIDSSILGFLSGTKVSPDRISRFLKPETVEETEGQNMRKRTVIYRPETPIIVSILYGKKTFAIKISALVDEDGNVKKTELVTTTGYPQLDIMAAKYVKNWIFEPGKTAEKRNEWQTVDAVIRTEDLSE